jgi:hypothetical protein
VTAGAARPRPRAQGDEASSALDESAAPAMASIFSAGDLGFSDFRANRAAWICGGIIALMVLTVMLSFGFAFGALMRGPAFVTHLISGTVLFVTAALAMAGAIYGGSLMAPPEARHNLRFALLLLVFAVELLLFLYGEAAGKPRGVSWMLIGAVVAGMGLWARLRHDRLLASVAELTVDAV